MSKRYWKQEGPSRKGRIWLAGGVAAVLLVSAVIAMMGADILPNPFRKAVQEEVPDYVSQALLTPNPYSRPQTPLDKVNNIVIHYVGNPNTSAMANRNYFESLKDTQATQASSHFIVGLEGEVVQCVPLSEISYCTSRERNLDTIAIEVCHPDETGQFNPDTYASVVRLTAWLCGEYGLTEQEVIRHYDVTGKLCPKYYVEHEDAWQQFLADVKTAMQGEE